MSWHFMPFSRIHEHGYLCPYKRYLFNLTLFSYFLITRDFYSKVISLTIVASFHHWLIITISKQSFSVCSKLKNACTSIGQLIYIFTKISIRLGCCFGKRGKWEVTLCLHKKPAFTFNQAFDILPITNTIRWECNQ